MGNDKKLKILLDTGSNKNYINPKFIKSPKQNERNFKAKSIKGDIEITQHKFIKLFDDTPIKFFLLPELETFDAILGNDSLKEFSAVIHTAEDYFTVKGGRKVPIKQYISQSVNNIEIRTNHLSEYKKKLLENIVNRHKSLFADPDESLTYTTRVVGEIRTTTETPVYSKNYPYPMALRSIVDEEISKLLKDQIIRPSRSPYNSPIWIVPKKQDASGKDKYRVVVDFRKLNTVTIADRYPIPEINDVLSHLGGNKYFTVIDLKSGFHQIPLRMEDVEKTAFSVNNGKYEFLRLPFGLKNAPSIFQRTLDDILREHIGKRCFVYIDDIIIFSKDEDSHFKDLEAIFETLNSANMKVQLDKCEFFKEEVEFLGFIVSHNGIKANPKKVQAIVDFPYPNNVKELRSFLGLSGYYRRFIKGYANIAKPLTKLLRGDGGLISKKESSKRKIKMDSEAKQAIDNLKNALISQEVILSYPDFQKEFHLTTDASNVAIGAVLSQDDRPISFISRTLTTAEESYAANEKEMLAIIWALTHLRNYLYGSAKVIIYTDHQPLTYALSNKNNNAKMKRWKAILEEYNYEMKYKPGKSNVVADALSRPPGTNINSLTGTVHSSDSSPEKLIPSVEVPINAFKNQIFLEINDTPNYNFQIIFPGYHRHSISEPEYDTERLISILKRYLKPSVINCIKTPEFIMGKIQEIYPHHFVNFKIRFTQLFVEDILSESDQETIIIETHNRAHRNAVENKMQILEKAYFPSMFSKIKRILKLCSTCKRNKYDRHPSQPRLNATPIPNYPGQVIHIDIFSTDRKLVLTAIDKFSKYAQTKILQGKSIEDIRRPLRDILFFYGVPKTVVMDNEKSLNSATILFMMKDELGIEVFTTPPYKSEANGQIERFHSTLAEILRCLKEEGICRNFEELLERSVNEYNHSIHSTIGKKPVDMFFGRTVDFSPGSYERTRENNIKMLKRKQEKDLNYHNKDKDEIKQYIPGQEIFVRVNKRLGTKLSEKFKRELVKENRHSTVVTESGRVVHKKHIKN